MFSTYSTMTLMTSATLITTRMNSSAFYVMVSIILQFHNCPYTVNHRHPLNSKPGSLSECLTTLNQQFLKTIKNRCFFFAAVPSSKTSPRLFKQTYLKLAPTRWSCCCSASPPPPTPPPWQSSTAGYSAWMVIIHIIITIIVSIIFHIIILITTTTTITIQSQHCTMCSLGSTMAL